MTSPRLLLVNYDGVGAVGLTKLQAAARTISDDVWTVAPAAERSGASHAISLTLPIRARRLGDREYAVDGTPVDCVAVALGALVGPAPDFVLSGVNRGPNLADDIVYSGTCGAAREAALRGIPSMALSLTSVPHQDDDWGGVDAHLAPLLATLIAVHSHGFLNINFPSRRADAIAGTRVTRVGTYPPDRLIPRPGTDPRNVPYWWLELEYPIGAGPAGTDISAVSDGFISVTPIRADLTDDTALEGLTRHLTSG